MPSPETSTGVRKTLEWKQHAPSPPEQVSQTGAVAGLAHCACQLTLDIRITAMRRADPWADREFEEPWNGPLSSVRERRYQGL